MGKKGKVDVSLGQALIKARFKGHPGRKGKGEGAMLHTTDLQDGYDWGRLNLQSVTEQSSFEEFLATAELAGTEFTAEKLNIKFVNPRSNVGLLSAEEKAKLLRDYEENKTYLKIPRRPKWDANTSPEELDQNERESFLQWRKQLSLLQEERKLLMTPYEKNLEFWRQLWRVIERSDVIVQIVDARNPLIFRCEDLENYVKEVSEDKVNVVLINKADFLSHSQRVAWAEYFEKINLRAVFFSAIAESIIEPIKEDENEKSNEQGKEDSTNTDPLSSTSSESKGNSADEVSHLENALVNTVQDMKKELDDICKEEKIVNCPDVLTREELIEFLRNVPYGNKGAKKVTTIGLVGYPNVGKSSTINSLLMAKKVSVSATPGKTKHFQTLYLTEDILLCDCPGLVMPSFVFTKADMVIHGILPIDQMKDHVPPVNLVATLIPRHILEDKYGILIPKPLDGEDPDRPPYAEELLNAYGFIRGFMTANGQPDNPRSARYILKDFVNGKLLYCSAPPGIDQAGYHKFPERQKNVAERVVPPREARATKSLRTTTEDLNEVFFKTALGGAHQKGVIGKMSGLPSSNTSSTNPMASSKPWKQINKHVNKKKKEKLRRVYSYLDEH